MLWYLKLQHFIDHSLLIPNRRQVAHHPFSFTSYLKRSRQMREMYSNHSWLFRNSQNLWLSVKTLLRKLPNPYWRKVKKILFHQPNTWIYPPIPHSVRSRQGHCNLMAPLLTVAKVRVFRKTVGGWVLWMGGWGLARRKSRAKWVLWEWASLNCCAKCVTQRHH